jgi:hypothetical protein
MGQPTWTDTRHIDTAHWGQHALGGEVINVCDGTPYREPQPHAEPCSDCDTVVTRDYRARA